MCPNFTRAPPETASLGKLALGAANAAPTDSERAPVAPADFSVSERFSSSHYTDFFFFTYSDTTADDFGSTKSTILFFNWLVVHDDIAV